MNMHDGVLVLHLSVNPHPPLACSRTVRRTMTMFVSESLSLTPRSVRPQGGQPLSWSLSRACLRGEARSILVEWGPCPAQQQCCLFPAACDVAHALSHAGIDQA